MADVSGHGVPAALIAAMIKVAMQSLVHCANMPGEVLSGLNRILSGQLRSQLVSAAYLWLDMEHGCALYSAAGHPPLILWRQRRLERIESNGILIGSCRMQTIQFARFRSVLETDSCFTPMASLNPRTPRAIHLAIVSLKTSSAGISRGRPRICRRTCLRVSAAGNLHR